MPTGQSPENSRWWSDFLRDHGKDSEEEEAFLGYISERHIAPLEASADDLDRHYAAFYLWFLGLPPPETRRAAPPPPRPRGR